jgi:hypothetical protein
MVYSESELLNAAFRSGKRPISDATFQQLLQGREQLAPSAKVYCCELLSAPSTIVTAVEQLTPQDLGQIIKAIANRFG